MSVVPHAIAVYNEHAQWRRHRVWAAACDLPSRGRSGWQLHDSYEEVVDETHDLGETRKVDGLGDEGVGAPFDTSAGRPPRPLTPDRIVAFRTITGAVCPDGRYELTALGDATEVRFTLTAELRGLKRAMAPIVTKTMRSEVGNLDRLKAALEAGNE